MEPEENDTKPELLTLTHPAAVRLNALSMALGNKRGANAAEAVADAKVFETYLLG